MSSDQKLLYVGHTNPWGEMSGSGFSPRVCQELQDRGLLFGGIQPFDPSSRRYLTGKGYNGLPAKIGRKLRAKLSGNSGTQSVIVDSERDGLLPEMLGQLTPGSPVFYHFHVPKLDPKYDLKRYLFQDLTPFEAQKFQAYGFEDTTEDEAAEVTANIKEVMHSDGIAGVFTFSTHAADMITKTYDYPREKVTALGCGPIRSYWHPEKMTEERFARAQILFVGRNWEKKAGDPVIDAFKDVQAKIPHATLCIVGPRTQPESTVGVPGVKFYGRIEDDEVASLFAESSMHIMAPDCETWGIVYTEAANAGLPIVSVNSWALPDIVTDGVTGRLAAEKTADHLAEAMLDVLSDPARMVEMGHAAHKHVEEVLDWPHVIGRMMDRCWPELGANAPLLQGGKNSL